MSPSELAAAALCLSCRVINEDTEETAAKLKWEEKMVHYSGYIDYVRAARYVFVVQRHMFTGRHCILSSTIQVRGERAGAVDGVHRIFRGQVGDLEAQFRETKVPKQQVHANFRIPAPQGRALHHYRQIGRWPSDQVNA